MKYLVMETHSSYAVVLDNEGCFHKVANLNYEPGQKLDQVYGIDRPDSSGDKKNTYTWLKAAAAVAACVALILSIIALWPQGDKKIIEAKGLLEVEVYEMQATKKPSSGSENVFPQINAVNLYEGIEFDNSAWCEALNHAPGLPIKLSWPEEGDNVEFDISTERGSFLALASNNWYQRWQKQSVANESTLYWINRSADNDDYVIKGNDFIKIITREDDHLLGYAVIRIDSTEETENAFYKPLLLKSVFFPKVEGEYQNVTEEYVQSKIRELTTERKPDEGEGSKPVNGEDANNYAMPYFDPLSSDDLERLNDIGASVIENEVLSYDEFIQEFDAEGRLSLIRPHQMLRMLKIYYPNGFSTNRGDVYMNATVTGVYDARTGFYFGYSVTSDEDSGEDFVGPYDPQAGQKLPASEVIARRFIEESFSLQSQLTKWIDLHSTSTNLKLFLDHRTELTLLRRELSDSDRNYSIYLEKKSEYIDDGWVLYHFEALEDCDPGTAITQYMILLGEENEEWKIKSALSDDGSSKQLVGQPFVNEVLQKLGKGNLQEAAALLEKMPNEILDPAEMGRISSLEKESIAREAEQKDEEGIIP
ncbi:MAG: hypothetical protein PHR78_01360 [Eubacteriales bacterium]|nr:hypothetical protein [Eubacteriales bacterium]